MKPELNRILEKFSSDPFLFSGHLILMVCAAILLFSIAADFILFHKKSKIKKELRSWVETGSMFGFFILYYFIIRSGLGKINFEGYEIRNVLIATGSATAISGCIINIFGRINLRHNWANQVTIYSGQTLVTNGIYKYIRHPLYSSIILMLTGASLINTDLTALLSVALIFIPMMYYRAKQEEKMLSEEFEDYKVYKNKTGMFFPGIK